MLNAHPLNGLRLGEYIQPASIGTAALRPFTARPWEIGQPSLMMIVARIPFLEARTSGFRSDDEQPT